MGEGSEVTARLLTGEKRLVMACDCADGAMRSRG